MRRNLFVCALLGAGFLITGAARADAGKIDVSDLPVEAIEQIVHDYLLDNPEILLAVQEELERRVLEAEMEKLCQAIPGPKMANMVEQGDTPILPPARLRELGYAIAAYPLTLLSASVRAMQDALVSLGDGETPERLVDFADLREIVGFGAYEHEQARYRED